MSVETSDKIVMSSKQKILPEVASHQYISVFELSKLHIQARRIFRLHLAQRDPWMTERHDRSLAM